MATYVFKHKSGEVAFTYLNPTPEALDRMALKWWTEMMQESPVMTTIEGQRYSVRLSSSIAAAYESQAWVLDQKTSELSKACFFRKLALSLARKVKSNFLAELKAKYAFALLVKATFMRNKGLASEAVQLTREAILLKPSTPESKWLLAHVLLWSVWHLDVGSRAGSDVDMAIEYIDQVSAANTNQTIEGTPKPQADLQKALELRYILNGEAVDIQRSFALWNDDRIGNGEDDIKMWTMVFAVAHANYSSDKRALVQVMRATQAQLFGHPDEVASQPGSEKEVSGGSVPSKRESDSRVQAADGSIEPVSQSDEDVDIGGSSIGIDMQPSDDLDLEDNSFDLGNLFPELMPHRMTPELATEGLEAGLLDIESPTDAKDSGNKAVNHGQLGLGHLLQYGTGQGHLSDLESAMSHLELAEREETIDTKNHSTASIFLAIARFKLGQRTGDVCLLETAITGLASIIDELTAQSCLSPRFVMEIMEKAHHFWTLSKFSTVRADFLDASVRLFSFLLREDVASGLSPRETDYVLCTGGKIAADWCSEHPGQTKLLHPVAYWKRCWRDQRLRLNSRLQAMHLAAKHLFGEGRYSEAFHHARKAVELIRFACPAHLEMSDRVSLVPLLNGISVDACALGIKLGRVNEALELLEQGRGILNFLPDAFADNLDQLAREYPELFEKFEKCRQNVATTITYLDASGHEAGNSAKYDDVIDEDSLDNLSSILTEIRQKPGFENFYQPMTVSQMQGLACNGSIIVLVGSSLIPYAVILNQQSIKTVQLSLQHIDTSKKANFFGDWSSSILNQITGRELFTVNFSDDGQTDVKSSRLSDAQRSVALQDLLHILWVRVIEPINNVLSFKGPPGPTIEDSLFNSIKNQVSWIRTGVYSRMPMHAALSEDDVPFISYAVSSYMSNFQSLSAAQKRTKAISQEQGHGLLITMPSKSNRPTFGGPFLRAEIVQQEVSNITQSAESIQWSKLERPSAERVKHHFTSARYAHFICHGILDPEEPRKSHLKLWQDLKSGKGRVDPLYLSEIASWQASKTALVFLSACSVADTENKSFSDENLDIANAFAVAGVPNVVGSMWPVSSSVATTLSGWFWNYLNWRLSKGTGLDGGMVAQALHIATIEAASRYVNDPLMWAGFIHIGAMGGDASDDASDDGVEATVDRIELAGESGEARFNDEPRSDLL